MGKNPQDFSKKNNTVTNRTKNFGFSLGLSFRKWKVKKPALHKVLSRYEDQSVEFLFSWVSNEIQ